MQSSPPSSPVPSEHPQSFPPRRRPPGYFRHTREKNTLSQFAFILGVAFVLATLFTSWTPGHFGGTPIAPLGNKTFPTPLPSPTFPPGKPSPTVPPPNRVGIVAGHWKSDSGAVCPDGLREVDINLQIATRVQKLLKDAGVPAELLAEFDLRLNDYQAAALVSIHNDSCDFVENATGFKVATALNNKNPEKGAYLTACLRARYAEITGLPLHSTSVTRDMTSYHAFREIHDSTPAVIIETGFMNQDRQLLTERTDLVALGVAQGILCYLRNEPVTIFPLPTPSLTP